MSKKETGFITDRYGKKLFVRKWLPDGTPKASLQIIHGMSEHSGRYSHVGSFFASHGFVVFAHDHRGHGQTDPDRLGFLDHEAGFDVLAENIGDVKKEVCSEYLALPEIMLGHSMGSFCLQRYMQLYDSRTNATIYSGSNGRPPLMLNAGIWLAGIQKKLFGPDARSPLIDHLTFGKYNSHFKPARTKSDWLNRDKDMVNMYIDDPFAGFIFTNNFFLELFRGLKKLHKHELFAGYSKSVPILLISGSDDPVSNMGKGVRDLERRLLASGATHVDVQLYPGGRHEMLNEMNRKEVLQNLLSWIKKNV